MMVRLMMMADHHHPFLTQCVPPPPAAAWRRGRHETAGQLPPATTRIGCITPEMKSTRERQFLGRSVPRIATCAWDAWDAGGGCMRASLLHVWGWGGGGGVASTPTHGCAGSAATSDSKDPRRTVEFDGCADRCMLRYYTGWLRTTDRPKRRGSSRAAFRRSSSPKTLSTLRSAKSQTAGAQTIEWVGH